ncbi:hypothetical protein N0V83_009013 [Neocucurbitaria cava]|uniref:Uncharacterized protein n=1 Tax=Neocucurbitaria cava TaxID=798079 RepID=A0A9W8Y0A4_9PLEO|nr:hypothetical protein N0V83_009013 [Neocucurbitaria cava]
MSKSTYTMDEHDELDELRSTRTAKRSGGVTVDEEMIGQRRDEQLELSWVSWYDYEDHHTTARAALQRAREKKRKLQDMESDGPQAQPSRYRQASPQAISNRHIQRAPTTPATTQQAEIPSDDIFNSNAPSFMFHRASFDDARPGGSRAMPRVGSRRDEQAPEHPSSVFNNPEFGGDDEELELPLDRQEPRASIASEIDPRQRASAGKLRAPTDKKDRQPAELPLRVWLPSSGRWEKIDELPQGVQAKLNAAFEEMAMEKKKYKTLWASWTDPSNIGTHYDACQFSLL